MADLATPCDPDRGESGRVVWVVTRADKNRWLVSNVGDGVARRVTVNTDALGGVRVEVAPDLPADIGPWESVAIVAISAFGAPIAEDVHVTWGGHEHVTLPLPRW